MGYIMVDVEVDGPIPGDYSMVSFGAVIVDESLDKTFFARLRPLSGNYVPSMLKVSGYTREETMQAEDPLTVIKNFKTWIQEHCKEEPFFISDNGLDWMFMAWYFHHFLNENPFGHDPVNIGSLYKDMVRDTFKNHKHLMKTPHNHHPLQDALGNAEALLKMKKEMGLKIRLHL